MTNNNKFRQAGTGSTSDRATGTASALRHIFNSGPADDDDLAETAANERSPDRAREAWGRGRWGQQARPRNKSRLEFLSLADLDNLPPLEWLVDDFLPKPGLCVLYGQPKAGKSFLALEWAMSIAAGVPTLERRTIQGEVVYCCGGEGLPGLKQRRDAWLRQRGIPAPSQFHLLKNAVDVANQAEMLIAAIRANGWCPSLIVIDTLAKNFGGGDENSTKDMNAFVAGCIAIQEAFPGATILIVHHVGKDEGKGSRGSSALLGAVDAAFLLTSSKPKLAEPADRQRIKLTTTYMKDGEKQKPWELELHTIELGANQFGKRITSCVVALPEQAPAGAEVAARASETDARLLAALVKLGGATGSVSAKAWRDEVGGAESTFHKARKRLLESGKVIEPEPKNYRLAVAAASASKPSCPAVPSLEPRSPGSTLSLHAPRSTISLHDDPSWSALRSTLPLHASWSGGNEPFRLVH
jgi:AAA domain